MRRADLEHIIRAAGTIAQAKELIIIGSQAILATYPDAPDELLVSQEADVFSLEDPSHSELIDGSIGELSPFHDSFGYFAHGVGADTARFPRGWKSRLVTISNSNTHGITGLCLSPVDIAVSKLLAGREKDLAYVNAMLSHNLLSEGDVIAVLDELDANDQQLIRDRVTRIQNS